MYTFLHLVTVVHHVLLLRSSVLFRSITKKNEGTRSKNPTKKHIRLYRSAVFISVYCLIVTVCKYLLRVLIENRNYNSSSPSSTNLKHKPKPLEFGNHELLTNRTFEVRRGLRRFTFHVTPYGYTDLVFSFVKCEYQCYQISHLESPNRRRRQIKITLHKKFLKRKLSTGIKYQG